MSASGNDSAATSEQEYPSVEGRIATGELSLPEPFAFPSNNRTGCVRVGNLLFLSGHPPIANGDGRVLVHGKVPETVTEQEAYLCARSAALAMLASIRREVGSLDAIKRVVKVFGMVNSSPGFDRQFAVIDGASDLFIEMWGPLNGQHARSAVGMYELPRGFPVEIEAVFELHD